MRKQKSLDDYMAEVIKSNASESQRGWELLAWKAFEKDVTMRRAFFNYGVANYFKAHVVETASPHEVTIKKRSRHYNKSARPRTRKARKLRTEKQRTVIGLTMFKWIMQQPCGALVAMGGAVAALGKLGKPTQILGNVVSVVDARNVLLRNGCDVPSVGNGEAKPSRKAAHGAEAAAPMH